MSSIAGKHPALLFRFLSFLFFFSSPGSDTLPGLGEATVTQQRRKTFQNIRLLNQRLKIVTEGRESSQGAKSETSAQLPVKSKLDDGGGGGGSENCNFCRRSQSRVCRGVLICPDAGQETGLFSGSDNRPTKIQDILFDIARPRERLVETLSFFWLRED